MIASMEDGDARAKDAEQKAVEARVRQVLWGMTPFEIAIRKQRDENAMAMEVKEKQDGVAERPTRQPAELHTVSSTLTAASIKHKSEVIE